MLENNHKNIIEKRIFGPPGTGKTTRMATVEIPAAVEEFGSNGVMVTSFTKAAAAEIAGKKSVKTGNTIAVNAKNVGTLHAICYRELKQPKIAELHKDEWNNEQPGYLMNGSFKGDMDLGGLDEGGDSPGEKDLNRLNILRARMIPKEHYPKDIRHFTDLWNSWKNIHGYMDYTDLIEYSLENMPVAPGNPDVIFVDEAQDFTKLQLSLVRSWGQHTKYITLVGDDDQTIYQFTGASHNAFLYPLIDYKYKRKLEQSYRVPKKVFDRAMTLIKQVSNREPKTYFPRNEDGEVIDHHVNYKEPEIMDEIKDALKKKKTIMILGSCAYMVEPIKRKLKSDGIPFSNKYRLKRKDWNPLSSAGAGKTTIPELLASFFTNGPDNGYWTVEQMLNWIKFLKVGESGLIRKQGKQGIKLLQEAVDQRQEGLQTTRNVLSQLLTERGVQAAMDRNIDWLKDNLVKTKIPGMDYPLAVYNNYGLSGLQDQPQVTIGTIHSVKGGEADIVYLFPDISWKSYKSLSEEDSNEKYDALIRLFYVGMTRAREKLVLCKPLEMGNNKTWIDL